MIYAIIKKLNIEDDDAISAIRVYEMHSNKIQRELTRSHAVISITDYVQLAAEIIPVEDRGVSNSEFIYAFHFQNESNKTHGIPFKFRIMEVSVESG